MNLKTSHSTPYFLLILLISNLVFSQAELTNKGNFKTFDSLNNYYNNGIFNGSEFVDRFMNFKKGNHKFYHTEDYLLGDVLYNGQPYFDVKLKYELTNDILIVEYVNQMYNYLKLNTEFVEEFIIEGAKFYRLVEHPNLMRFYGNGYFKEGYKGTNYTFFIKYMKSQAEKVRDQRVYYVFEEQTVYVLSYNNQYHRVNTIKDVIHVLPQNKDQIQKFHTQYRRLYKKDREQFLENLFKNLES